MNTLVKLKSDLKVKIEEIKVLKKEVNEDGDGVRSIYFYSLKEVRNIEIIDINLSFNGFNIMHAMLDNCYEYFQSFKENRKKIDNKLMEAKTIRANIRYLESVGYTEKTKESNKIIGERI